MQHKGTNILLGNVPWIIIFFAIEHGSRYEVNPSEEQRYRYSLMKNLHISGQRVNSLSRKGWGVEKEDLALFPNPTTLMLQQLAGQFIVVNKLGFQTLGPLKLTTRYQVRTGTVFLTHCLRQIRSISFYFFLKNVFILHNQFL